MSTKKIETKADALKALICADRGTFGMNSNDVRPKNKRWGLLTIEIKTNLKDSADQAAG
ncbi:hypothetical protein D3C72_1863110 [compost metagenome]